MDRTLPCEGRNAGSIPAKVTISICLVTHMTNPNSQKHVCTKTLDLLGDFWVLRLIDVLSTSRIGLRYCEIERAIPDISPAMLTNRLKKMDKALLLKRAEKSVDKISVTYQLSALGREAIPILRAYERFAKKATR